MTKIPYSGIISVGIFLDLLTPEFKKLLEKEEDYLKNYLRRHLTPRSKVIEIGSGSGRLLETVSPFVEEAIGIERDYLQIQSVESLLRKGGNIKFVYGDGRDIPYPANYFDLAFSCFNTLGNQGYDKFRVLMEMRRVVKPKRSVVVSVYAENAANHQIELYRKIGWKDEEIRVVGDFVVLDSNMLGSNISERFSRDKLARLFQDTGFTDFTIDNLTDFSYVVNARK